MFNRIWKRSNQKITPEKAKTIQQITVFGSANIQPESKLFIEVSKVTEMLALAGYIIVDGGGPGVMRAATEGAHTGGGKVIGVTFYSINAPGFEGKDKQNDFDIEIKTENYVERTITLLKEGQIYLIFNGATGTLSEFSMAWGLARLYFGHHKPLILYGNFWKKIMKVLKQNMLLRPEEEKVYKIVDSPYGVIKAIMQFETELEEGKYTHLKASKEEGAFVINT